MSWYQLKGLLEILFYILFYLSMIYFDYILILKFGRSFIRKLTLAFILFYLVLFIFLFLISSGEAGIGLGIMLWSFPFLVIGFYLLQLILFYFSQKHKK